MLMMRFLLLALSAPTSLAFMVPRQHQPQTNTITATTSTSTSTTFLRMSTPDADKMKQILEEEATNPENMKATADMMKNLKPEDIDNMLKEMDSMPATQREQMKAMGMNPDIMRQSIEMMKSNPDMAKQMSEMMATMTPEEMLEKSRQAQANFSGGVAPGAPVVATPSVVDAQVENKDADDDGDEDEEETSEPIPAPDAEILDTMFRTAELMSSPPTGKVSLQGFSTIPPIALLTGDDTDRDLSRRELNECWADGSLGSTRVDRAGFERVWMEVQDFFSLPIMEKALQRSVEKPNKKGGAAAATSPTPAPIVSDTSKVGASISSEDLKKQVNGMDDNDMDSMLDQMKDMSPEQIARMKDMGVDPAMLQKTASMLKGNPLMKNAAKMMMKNMTPEQMKNASQQAQSQMKNMKPEDMDKMMADMEKQSKGQ